jgi:hypothetical protein
MERCGGAEMGAAVRRRGGAAARRRGGAAARRQCRGSAEEVQTAARKSRRLQRKHARSHLTRATKRRLNLRRGRRDTCARRP